ncbi:hypothetical protein C8J57DRAFT_1679298 [Mycena rebaudengoi]|nr:hypothetical protein C8J57DRAFT_1679298 [Mycena rebaudengoi]
MSTLALARNRVYELDHQISELDTKRSSNRSALQHERRSNQRQLDAYTYPILTLPDDIVSEIFTHFLPVYPLRPLPLGPDCPTHLANIGRRWRYIALSTPSLWRAIHIEVHVVRTDLNEQLVSQNLRLLESWIARSKSCPLSICIEYYDDALVYPTDCITLIRTIIPHRARWEHMFLVVPFQVLELWTGLRLRSHAFFHDAPNLTALILMTTNIPSAISLPWAQLTTLEAWVVEHQCISLLQQARNLVHCTLHLVTADPHIRNDMHVPPLVALHSLILTASTASWRLGLMRLLPALTLPSLRVLEVSESGFFDDPCAIVQTLVSRSDCTLVELRITRARNPDGFYREAFPDIETITVIRSCRVRIHPPHFSCESPSRGHPSE